jgi:type IV pilus secretin PilQ/predicted competence protein
MIAISEGKARRTMAGTIRNLTATLLVAAAAGVLFDAGLDATPATVRLVGVSAQGDALVIEATEPVAYTVNRPDPQTLIVDMRNVSAADARNDVARQGAIAGVRVEQTTSVDGRAVARVHVALTRPASHTVRSVRNTIRVELTAGQGAQSSQAAQTPTAAAAKPATPQTPPPATQPPAAPAKSTQPPAQPAASAPAKPTPPAPAPAAAAQTPLRAPSQSTRAAAAVPPKTVATPVTDVEKGASSATSLERVQSTKSATTTTVTLSGNGRLAPANVTESKDRPRRLVLDFPNVGSKAPTQTAIDSQLVSRVRVGLNSSQPLVTRVVMELSSDATYRVERSGEEGRDLDVVFEPRVPSGVRVPVDSARVNESPSAAADSSRPSAAADSSKEEPITLQQAIANAAAITPKDDKPADAPRAASAPAPASRPAASQSLASQAPASRPSASQPPPSQPIDAMAALRSSLITAPAASPAPAPASAAALAAKTSTSSATPSGPSAPSAPARASAPPQAVPNSLAAQAAAPAQTVLRPTTPAQQTTPTQEPQTQQTLQTQGRQFTGHPVSLDFEGVDLRAVLRTFSDVSGLNLVIDPDVQGTVDIKLTDVPWDQALDVILRGNQLDYTVDGTIVRISRVKTLEDENKSRVAAAQAAAERAAQAGGMAFETYPLSYAKAADTAPLLRGSLRLSRYGQVQVDARTNTLIIADLPEQLPVIRQLLQTLDRPEPQVEIEARIITTTREFARAIGVQWGLNGRMTPEIGNTTNLAFPNSGTVGGRLGSQGPQGSDVRANPTDRAGTVVNLPAEAANTAIGLALGSINGAFNLDVALSALERTGKGRILSTPRVTTQNNVEAEITQGVQIPVQTEANNTVTVTFKDAALTLKVTPQITAANTVIMQITVENAAPGTLVDNIPSIDTQRAITRVQVSDGVTTVMGGIFVQRESNTLDKTPVLHRIPLLGWLFKRDSQTDESRELLIFITPRILKG